MPQRSSIVVLLALLVGGGSSYSQESLRPSRHAIPKGHPGLFGSAEQILQLSRAKPALWNAVLKAAETGSPPAALRARTRGFASLVTNDPKHARAAIADVQVAIIPDAGHAPQVEQPAAFTAILARFLAGGEV